MANHQLTFLAIGSNVPPRKEYISKSLEALKDRFPEKFDVSSIYLTKPYHNLKQDCYYNCCVRFICDVSAFDLLDLITKIEGNLGRVRSKKKWDSRVIDLDIVFYGNEIISEPRLTIPHYDLSNRDFFIVPLLELDKTLKHPETGLFLKTELLNIPTQKRTNPINIGKPSI